MSVWVVMTAQNEDGWGQRVVGVFSTFDDALKACGPVTWVLGGAPVEAPASGYGLDCCVDITRHEIGAVG